MEGSNEAKYGVYRLDIYNAPGWILVRQYDNLNDAEIYCTMLVQDTGTIYRVFEDE